MEGKAECDPEETDSAQRPQTGGKRDQRDLRLASGFAAKCWTSSQTSAEDNLDLVAPAGSRGPAPAVDSRPSHC